MTKPNDSTRRLTPLSFGAGLLTRPGSAFAPRKHVLSRSERRLCLSGRRVRNPRLIALAAGTLATLLSAFALPRHGQGQDADVKANPDLLRSIPFDRITLIDGSVLIVDPVSPRPLPVHDPSKQKPKIFRPPSQGNIGLPGEKSKVVMPGEAEKEEEIRNEVPVHLLQGEVRDFKVKRASIRRIEYFEDMLLADGERRVLARDYTRAFECYLRVKSRQPSWPGLDEHVNRLLFEEGSTALLDGDGERGLRLLGELFTRKANYPGLADKLAASYGSRANRAFELGLYARGRSVLHELELLAPSHPTVRDTRDRFLIRARHPVEEAARRKGAERLDALTDAVRVWPSLDGAGALYEEAFRAAPTLDVAVADISRPIGPWTRGPADERVTRLLYIPILARGDDEAAQGKAAGQIAARFETADVGRRLILQVRPGIAWSDGSRAVAPIDVARALTDRTEPSSPQFNARWADLLERVEVSEEGTIEARLRRAFLKPATWLLGPVGPAHGGWDGRVATNDRGRQLVSDGPFLWAGSTDERIEFRIPEKSPSADGPKIHRIRESRPTNAKATVGALLRGEVTMLEHVPPDRVAGLAANAEIKVGRYSRPSLHRLAFDSRNPVLRNRALRRGLSYAIDRKTLLEDTLLRRPSDGTNVVSDGPFAKGSYADATDVRALEYDPLLARMLVVAARKELGGAPIKLTLEYPARAEPQAVVPKLVEAFRLVGVEIQPIERPESLLENELRAGRRFDLAYRASRCEEPVLDAGNLICPGYDAPPSTDPLASLASPRILQLLLQLEQAPEWPTAKGIVVQLDREARDELPVLPLWQLEDHYAWRTRLKGPAEVADSLYQGIETWEIEPWYARDPW